jgi:hypothetical protein
VWLYRQNPIVISIAGSHGYLAVGLSKKRNVNVLHPQAIGTRMDEEPRGKAMR